MSDGLRTDNLVIPKGCTWGRAYPVNGFDLTGYTAKAQVRATRESSVVLYEWSTLNGTVLIDPVEKTVTLQHGPAVSAAWTWTTGVFDILLTSADTLTVIPVVQGAVRVDLTVTR
jgi:hypothetical protein